MQGLRCRSRKTTIASSVISAAQSHLTVEYHTRTSFALSELAVGSGRSNVAMGTILFAAKSATLSELLACQLRCRLFRNLCILSFSPNLEPKFSNMTFIFSKARVHLLGLTNDIM